MPCSRTRALAEMPFMLPQMTTHDLRPLWDLAKPSANPHKGWYHHYYGPVCTTLPSAFATSPPVGRSNWP